MDTRFDNLSHAKVRLLYHIVLATKYRKRCLLDIEDALRQTIVACAERSDFDIIDVAIDEGDHMHLLVRIRKPDVSVGQVVRRIKQDTTRVLWQNPKTRAVLEGFYRGRRHKLWSNGYFAATAGNDFKIVRGYIRNQTRWKEAGFKNPPLELRN